jgi:hypothetical protein
LRARNLRPQNRVLVLVRASTSVWPALLVILGGLVFMGYERFALDRAAYATESRTHTFWDPLLVGTISASPELAALYGMGQVPYGDNLGYRLAEQYIVRLNDITSPIAVVSDGHVTSIYAMHNMGAFDAIQRKIFVQILRDHPWLVIRSFLYDKPQAELKALARAWRLAFFNPLAFLFAIFLAYLSGAVIWLFDAGQIRLPKLGMVSVALVTIIILSLSTGFIYPSPIIPDAILLFLMLFLLGQVAHQCYY